MLREIKTKIFKKKKAEKLKIIVLIDEKYGKPPNKNNPNIIQPQR